jgi:hypothetical protein
MRHTHQKTAKLAARIPRVSVAAVASVAAAAVAVVAGATGAAATSGTTASGTLVVTSATPLGPPHDAGGNVILTEAFTGFKSGLWQWSDTVRLVIHPDGTFTAHGSGTFTGPAPGCGNVSGQWEIDGHGTVNPDGSLNGGGHAHSIAESSASPTAFTFSEDYQLDGNSGPYTITYAC